MKLFLGLWAILLSSAWAIEQGPTHSFDELSRYLYESSQGMIVATQSSDLKFDLNHRTKTATPQLLTPQPDLIHSLFETDVLRFIQNNQTNDFLTAKKKFYRKQKLNKWTQKYSRPYHYLSDWKSLNHNPIRKLHLPLELYGQQFKELTPEQIKQSPLLALNFQHHLDQLTQTELTAGNKLRLLSNGMNSFREKIRMVKQTKKFFHAVVMVQYCDESSSEMVDALIEKAQEGIDVRLILEESWTRLILQKCLEKLQNGGVKVTLGKGFLSPQTLFTVYHSKFWIRDGEEAIMGGQNMHDFENTSNGFNHQTRDKDVHVTGPAVTDMMRQYVRIWNHEHNNSNQQMNSYLKLIEEKEAHERSQGLRGQHLYSHWLEKSDPKDIKGVCRVLVQGTKTSGQENIIAKAYIEIMKNVKYQMFINTLSFNFKKSDHHPFGNSQIIKTLIESSQRGVGIDLVTNGVDAGFGEAGFQLRKLAYKLSRKGKKLEGKMLLGLEKTLAPFTDRGQRKNLSSALKGTNVDVWFYFNHIHSKQMEFDQIMTSTGSFNLDAHSHRNHESTLICLDKGLADESLRGFVSDLVNSTPVF